MKKVLLWVGALVVAGVIVAVWYLRPCVPAIADDAKASGNTVVDFPQTASNAFDAMDGGIALTEEETKGRNTWLLWTAGDQTFWDLLAQQVYGLSDLLKAIDSRQHNTRFRDSLKERRRQENVTPLPQRSAVYAQHWMLLPSWSARWK